MISVSECTYLWLILKTEAQTTPLSSSDCKKQWLENKFKFPDSGTSLTLKVENMIQITIFME